MYLAQTGTPQNVFHPLHSFHCRGQDIILHSKHILPESAKHILIDATDFSQAKGVEFRIPIARQLLWCRGATKKCAVFTRALWAPDDPKPRQADSGSSPAAGRQLV